MDRNRKWHLCALDVLDTGGYPVFFVEHMEKVEDSEAKSTPEHMKKRLDFAALQAQMQGTDTNRQWTNEVSPAAAGKCRRLGKAPTTSS